MGQPLFCSAANAGMWGERLWWWLRTLCLTQQYLLASIAAWLSSTGICYHSLLPHIPLICLSSINSSPHPGIAPQSLNSSSQPLHLPGDLCSSMVYLWLWQGLILIPFRLPQISCFTLSLKCFSSDSDSCPNVRIRPLLQFPHFPRAGPVSITLLFLPLVPLSYWVLRGSMYSFPLIRYSCLLSAGVLHAHLCLKVYSWCIYWERCAPRPPTPSPSCSPFEIRTFDKFSTSLKPYYILSNHFFLCSSDCAILNDLFFPYDCYIHAVNFNSGYWMLSFKFFIGFFFIVFMSLLRTCFLPLISKIFALATLDMVIIASLPDNFYIWVNAASWISWFVYLPSNMEHDSHGRSFLTPKDELLHIEMLNWWVLGKTLIKRRKCGINWRNPSQS